MNMPVEREDRTFRNYVVHRLIKESDYEFTARLTIRNISSEENDKNHQIILNTKLNPNTPELKIVQDFDVQVRYPMSLFLLYHVLQVGVFSLPQPEAGSSSVVTIVVIVILLILIIAVAGNIKTQNTIPFNN